MPTENPLEEKDKKNPSEEEGAGTGEDKGKTPPKMTAKQLKEAAAAMGFALADANALDKVLKGYEQQQKTIDELSHKLDAVADKGRLSNFEAGKPIVLTKVVRLNYREVVTDKVKGTTEPKVIVGWKILVDRVEKNPNTGVWTETQIVEVVYEDDTKEQMPYLDFATKTKFINATIQKRRKDEPFQDEHGVEFAGAEVLEVVTDSGKAYEIDSRFVN